MQVEENRKQEIEAVIVRIMKAQRRMHHNNLISEVIWRLLLVLWLQVTNELKNRFPPDITLIKRCVESLLERDYLARSEKDSNGYVYVA